MQTIVSATQKSRWVLLRSILIYCAPPYLFIPVGIAILSTLIPEEKRSFAFTCFLVEDLSVKLLLLRLFATSLAIPIAFPDYRRALETLLRLDKRKINVESVNSIATSRTRKTGSNGSGR
ncbi:hypothetical protein L596_012096 [Steinernema carpocapsae]|uniref:Uncharacterized protein n=1 Tax=Steinernema carpocapsae TaxID=34508 RepID=A0A4U5NWX3_STECR|nr:hypothetical protein L596_012096 [Steinernema carpocapsae]